MRFLKSDRLLSERDFSRLLSVAHSGGRSNILQCGPFKVYLSKEDKSARLGLAISRKVMRSSVQRNRVKRCVREFFRMHKSQLNGDYLIRLMRAPSGESCEEITAGLKRLIS